MLSIDISIPFLSMILQLNLTMRAYPVLMAAGISNIDISIEEVFDVLTNLDPGKASGLDNIGPGILKNSASILSKPLHYLFSLSLTSGKIPTK